MYAYIRGEVVAHDAESVVVDNAGIGYRILTPYPYHFQLGNTYTVHTYHTMRDDRFFLYGFRNADERALFMRLISVTGVGPKVAVAILSATTTENLVRAILTNDEKMLTSFPGVGKKTARQMILDLKDKLGEFEHTVGTLFDEALDAPLQSELQDEVELTLQALGYSDAEIRKAVRALKPAGNESAQELVKLALKQLSK
ncbi:MAG: Holliday junction branch migration protein RuvA [Bacilli bacterium]